MTTSSMSLQEMLAKRRELDDQILALSNKRNEAIVSVVRVMKNFAISLEDIREALGKGSGERVSTMAPKARKQAGKAATEAPKPTAKKTPAKKAAAKKATSTSEKQKPKSKEPEPTAPAAVTKDNTENKGTESKGPERNQAAPAAAPATSAPREYSYGNKNQTSVDDDEDPNPIPEPLSAEQIALLQGENHT